MTKTNHRMGVHLIGGNESNLRYIESLRPASIKVVDPDPNIVRRCLAALDPSPTSILVLRDHPLSEQKADMARDPAGTGRRHAQDWIQKLTTGRFKEFGTDPRIVVVGINEPDVHNQDEERIVFEYTKALLETLKPARIRALVFNFSVGWPSNRGGTTPVNWDTFRALEALINETNSLICVHEYWHPTPQNGWGWYANRISQCPMNAPILIGECAFTTQLTPEKDPKKWGWQAHMGAAQYADQLWYYHDKLDPRVHSIQPFTTGFAGAEWASKDTNPAHGEILKRVHAYQWPTGTVTPPVTQGGDMKLIWPKMPHITQFFGQGHSGLDIGMLMDTPIYAAADGVVAWVDTDTADNGGYGKYIRVYYPKLQAHFLYAHLNDWKVQQGQQVRRGELLGLSGSTGNSTGPHLHLEVRLTQEDSQTYRPRVSMWSKSQVDPLAFKYALAAVHGFEER